MPGRTIAVSGRSNIIIRRCQPCRIGEVPRNGPQYGMNGRVRGRKLGFDVNNAASSSSVVRYGVVRSQIDAAPRHILVTARRARRRVGRAIAVMAGEAELLGQDIINGICRMAGGSPRSGRIGGGKFRKGKKTADDIRDRRLACTIGIAEVDIAVLVVGSPDDRGTDTGAILAFEMAYDAVGIRDSPAS